MGHMGHCAPVCFEELCSLVISYPAGAHAFVAVGPPFTFEACSLLVLFAGGLKAAELAPSAASFCLAHLCVWISRSSSRLEAVVHKNFKACKITINIDN